MKISEAFYEIAKLAERLGVENICALPGCWEHQIDKRWWIALNGHDEDMKDSKGHTVPPFTAVVEFNGWPAGLIDLSGGVIAADEATNEDAFIVALKAAP